MASELCMNCFSVKGNYEVCPYCGYVEGTPPKQPHYLTPGTVIGGHFIVGTVIGFGGFGITYKCFDVTLGVVVAVKEFYPAGLVNRSPGESKVGLLSGEKKAQYRHQLKRFLMEAQSIAQFGNAKDIVNVYDFFEENGTAYIIMEYIDGVLLKDYLDKQGAVPPEAAMGIILPIIEAVKKIHSKGIVHQDISPDNIFIASEDSIKVFDFGAARLNDSKEGQDGESVIKVGYSAPEQYRDKRRQGYYTDVYSVGAIMYQLLTGIKPVESTEREHKDTLKSPKELGVKISSNTDRAVMEALAVQPELRFQGIQQFEEALENKRVAEYPKDKLKKRKRTRNGIIAVSALLAAAVAIVAGLYSTILKPEDPLFDTKYAGNTEITVWVENEDQKKVIDDLQNDGFKENTGADGEQSGEQVQKMQKDNEKVKVNVEVKTNLETELKKAYDLEKAGKPNQMPDMFLTDHVSDLNEYKLVSLKDNVYASLDTDNYMFMSQYEKQFPGMKEMPTGLNTLLVYNNKIEYNKNNTLAEGNETQLDVKDNTVELTDLISDDSKSYTKGKTLNEKLATFPADSEAKALSLLGNKTDAKAQNEIEQFNKTAMVNKYQINLDKKTKSGIYGSNVVAGVEYRNKMNKQLGNKDNNKVNPLSDYQTYVVTHNNKMLVTMTERYAISATSTKDEQLACERLLWVMLSESGQGKLSASQGETSFPILQSELNNFVNFNRKYGAFAESCEKQRPCILLGRETEREE